MFTNIFSILICLVYFKKYSFCRLCKCLLISYLDMYKVLLFPDPDDISFLSFHVVGRNGPWGRFRKLKGASNSAIPHWW